MKWDWCSGLDRHSTEISPHRFGVNSHTECLDPVLMADHFSICLGKSWPLSPNSWRGDAAKLLTGRLSQQGLWLPTTIRTKCYKKIKHWRLVWCSLCREGKNCFFQCAEVHQCCGGGEVTGWTIPVWAQSCSGRLCWAPGIQTCCCSSRRASSLERLYHC